MKKLRKSNKGFTLVELIIVIAIVAVLTAAIAPQYIKYVEKSRVTVDMDTAAAIYSAIGVICADGTLTTDDADYVTWDVSDGLIGVGKSAVEEITGTIPAAHSSKGKAADIVFSVDFNAVGTPIVTTNVDYTAWAN